MPLFDSVTDPANAASTEMSEPKEAPRSQDLEPPKPLTVSELTQQIRGAIEPQFAQVWVQGELSNVKVAPSGHAYFSLKDDGSQISAAIFGWSKSRSALGDQPRFELKDGLQVVCRGRVTVYAPRGNYQMTVERIEPLGAGALQLAFEQLKHKLMSEGLFESSRKRPIPLFPRRIVVVTSPTGAAIQDMLNVLGRRAPGIHVIVAPALVQGDQAAPQIVRAIETANRFGLGDLIVVARGGGSIEDLWAFNEEVVARAIAVSRLPVISAIGHEIDFTIADFVADLRAPTPSAAAEILSAQWVESGARVRDLAQRLGLAIQKQFLVRKNALSMLAARVVSPKDRLREQAQKCDELSLRLERAMRVRLDRAKMGLAQVMGKLDALSPLRVLERGYTLVRETRGSERVVVRSAHDLKSGSKVEITFHDGKVDATTV